MLETPQDIHKCYTRGALNGDPEVDVDIILSSELRNQWLENSKFVKFPEFVRKILYEIAYCPTYCLRESSDKQVYSEGSIIVHGHKYKWILLDVSQAIGFEVIISARFVLKIGKF